MDLVEWQKKEYTGMKPGLARMRKFAAAAGHPEKRFPAVHIAGTNGKGSSSRMIATVLAGAGYKTGIYTSPHLVAIEERIQIDGVPVSHSYLNRLAFTYENVAKRCSLSFFEFITGLAFIAFAEQRVDIAVIETGVGGRFDATNIIPAPLAAVITEIDYDHMDLLGGSLAKIAREKAGIIKKGSTVICGARRPSARTVILSAARAQGNTVFVEGKDFEVERYSLTRDGSGHNGFYRGIRSGFSYTVPLAGRHQARNAALALAAVESLIEKGYKIHGSGIMTSLKRTKWPGRFTVVNRNSGKNIIIVDGAHNPSGIRSLIATLSEGIWQRKKITFVFGVLRDKAFRPMAEMIAGRAERIITVPVKSERALDAGQLSSLAQQVLPGTRTETASSLNEAVSMACKDPVTVICGSLYLAGEFLKDTKRIIP